MALANAFLTGSRISQRGLRDERALDLDEKQLDLQSQRDVATRQNNRLKNRLNRLKFNADLVTDRDQPDIFRLQAANEYNRMVGLPITFTDITEIDKVQKVFEKQRNLIKRHEKGEIGSESLTRAIRGLQAEYNAVLGSTDAFAPTVKTAEEGAKREFENDVFKVSEILRKSAQGERATTEEASFIAKLKKSNNPRSQAVLRDGIQSSRGGGQQQVKQTADIQKFETVTGVDQSLRGTPEYQKLFFDFQEELKASTGGRKQFAGLTPEGLGVIFDPNTGKFETTDINAELLPKNKKLLSGEIAGQLGTFDSLIEQIGVIKKLAKDSPDLIGPVAGRWNKLKSRFKDNADFTELDRNVESLITIAYALSGKQISEREMRMLKGAILPAVTQPGANFEVALNFAEKWLTSNRDNRIKRLKSSGFFVGDIPTQQTSVTGKPILPNTNQTSLETRKQELLKRKTELESGVTQ